MENIKFISSWVIFGGMDHQAIIDAIKEERLDKLDLCSNRVTGIVLEVLDFRRSATEELVKLIQNLAERNFNVTIVKMTVTIEPIDPNVANKIDLVANSNISSNHKRTEID